MGSKARSCPKTGSACVGHCDDIAKIQIKKELFQLGNWYRPGSLNQLMELLKSFNTSKIKYRLVAGNTGAGNHHISGLHCKSLITYCARDTLSVYLGVYKDEGSFEAYVDITRVEELYQVTQKTPLTIGGGVTLTNLMELFKSIESTNSDYWYTPILAEHIGKIGSTPIRNVNKNSISSSP